MHRLQRITGHLNAPRTSLRQADCKSESLILLERQQRVGIITLNRPKAMNALNDELMGQVGQAVKELNADPSIGCIVLTGAGKAFAAGADIKEMASMDFFDAYNRDKLKSWEVLSTSRLPIIAAVNGVALGGGCEIAMMCDIIVASENAKFGQPEIKIGVLPGAGGSQRLTRAIGKSKAMEMILTGNPMDAREAERRGLVAAVVPAEQLMAHTLKLAQTIASNSRPAVMMAKEAVNAAYESSLTEGVRFERRLFHAAFALKDQKEGMGAFMSKRPANFTHC